MGRKMRTTEIDEPRPARPEPDTQSTVELRDVHHADTKQVKEIDIPEPVAEGPIIVPVTIPASRVRPGQSIQLLLDVLIAED